jgi:hypothetical protein
LGSLNTGFGFTTDNTTVTSSGFNNTGNGDSGWNNVGDTVSGWPNSLTGGSVFNEFGSGFFNTVSGGSFSDSGISGFFNRGVTGPLLVNPSGFISGFDSGFSNIGTGIAGVFNIFRP